MRGNGTVNNNELDRLEAVDANVSVILTKTEELSAVGRMLSEKNLKTLEQAARMILDMCEKSRKAYESEVNVSLWPSE